MQQGKTFALISDAGTPLLSDPGYALVQEMIKLQFPFTCIPGPNAPVVALVLSGFSLQPFSFWGFLPVQQNRRKDILKRCAARPDETLIFFESPDRVLGFIRELGEELGDRQIAVCRELTKLHEEVIRGKISELLPALSARRLIGEFTIVVAPGAGLQTVTMNESDLQTRFNRLQQEGLNRKEALKKLSRESGRTRNELYRLLFKR